MTLKFSIVTASRHLEHFCKGYGYPWLWFLAGSGCWVQNVYLQLTIIEYSSIGYLGNSDFLFKSAFQIMNMHRDWSTYNDDYTHTYTIVPMAIHMRAAKEHTGFIRAAIYLNNKQTKNSISSESSLLAFTYVSLMMAVQAGYLGVLPPPPPGGGDTLIFSHIRRLGPHPGDNCMLV